MTHLTWILHEIVTSIFSSHRNTIIDKEHRVNVNHSSNTNRNLTARGKEFSLSNIAFAFIHRSERNDQAEHIFIL